MILFFFFNDTATTEIYTYGHTLSLHDALPIFVELGQLRGIGGHERSFRDAVPLCKRAAPFTDEPLTDAVRSEEHTSELQSLMRISYAVFCLKKKKQVQQNQMKSTKIQIRQ